MNEKHGLIMFMKKKLCWQCVTFKDGELYPYSQVSYHCDQYNKLKNLTSKAIGKKMKAKEPQGDTNEVSDEAKNNIL